MPNLTVHLPSENYRRVRIWAAQNDTSVSMIVPLFLLALFDSSAEWEFPLPENPAAGVPAAKSSTNAVTSVAEAPATPQSASLQATRKRAA